MNDQVTDDVSCILLTDDQVTDDVSCILLTDDQVTDDVSCILLTDDQAESSAKLFNFDAYSDAFAEIIKSARTPFVIGIFGDWGCGKTSLMKTVEKKINKKLFIDDIEKPDSLANELLNSKNLLSVNLLERSPKLKKLLVDNKSMFNCFESLKSKLVGELKPLLDKYGNSSDKQVFEQLDDLSIAKIVNKLQDPKKQQSSQFINESQKLKDLLDKYLLLESLHNKFIEELNNLLDNPRFYNEANKKTFDVIDEMAEKATLDLGDGRIHYLKVKTENGETKITVKPTKKPQTKEDIFLFNRFLLENAYPGEIAQIQKDDDITVKTIWFNAWKYDKEDELWRTLLMRVLEELKIIPENLKRVETNWLTRRWRKLKSYRFPQFYLYDLDNFGNVAAKIRDETNPLSQYILKKFNEESKEFLYLYDDSPPLKKKLKLFVKELNKLLEDKNLFDEQRFLEVHLTDETKRLIDQKPQTDKDLKRLNRKLLQEAYWEENLNEKIEDLQTTLYQEISREEPGNLEFKPGKLFGGTVKLGISGQNPQVLPDALKDLSESIQKTKRIEHIQKIQFKEQFQHRFEEIIKTYYINRNKKVVIFIDDLDRCLPEKALEIIESIKTFMDIEGCIFVIGIDKDVISYIIRQKYKENIEKQEDESDRSEKFQINGENYLEKIIQLSFQLPPIKHDDLNILFNNLIANDKKFYKPYLKMIIEGIEPNPRKLKRFFNLIEFQRKLAEAIMPEKDSLYDCVMIIWTIISSTHPELSKAIIRDNSLFIEIFFKEILEDEKSKGTTEYLFSWDSISEDKRSKEIQKILKENFDVDWAQNADISKSEDGKTISIKKDNNSAEIEMIDKETGKATLKLSDGRTYDLKVESENGKQNIYKISDETDEDLPEIKKLSEDKLKLIYNVVAHVHDWVKEYSFSWDSVPGNDDKKLLKILKENFDVDWAQNADISKSEDGKTISIKKDNNSAEIEMIDKETGKSILTTENGKQNILTDIKEPKLKNIIDQVISLGHSEAEIESDEKKEKSVENMEREIEKKYGRRDKLGIDEIKQAIQNKQSLKGKDLTILSNEDEAKKLKTLNFTNMDLEGANLEGAYLQRAKFVRSKLSSAILENAHLKGAQFRNVKSWSAKFRGAHLDRAVIKDSEFYNADFSKAILQNANLSNVGLIRVRIDGTDFKDATLIGVDLKSAFFDENTDFRKADVDYITIHNLSGSNWEKTKKWGEDTLKEIEEKHKRNRNVLSRMI